MQHLDEGTIHTWLDGELPPEEAARVEAHVAECTQCSAAVAEARGLIAGSSRLVMALDGGVGARVNPGSRQQASAPAAGVARHRKSVWRRAWVPPVAAAAVLAGIIVLGNREGENARFASSTPELATGVNGGNPIVATAPRSAEAPKSVPPPAAASARAAAPPAAPNPEPLAEARRAADNQMKSASAAATAGASAGAARGLSAERLSTPSDAQKFVAAKFEGCYEAVVSGFTANASALPAQFTLDTALVSAADAKSGTLVSRRLVTVPDAEGNSTPRGYWTQAGPVARIVWSDSTPATQLTVGSGDTVRATLSGEVAAYPVLLRSCARPRD